MVCHTSLSVISMLPSLLGLHCWPMDCAALILGPHLVNYLLYQRMIGLNKLKVKIEIEIECFPMPERSTGDMFTSFTTSKFTIGKSLNWKQVSVSGKLRPTPNKPGGGRSDRADTGLLRSYSDGKNAPFELAESRTGSVLDMSPLSCRACFERAPCWCRAAVGPGGGGGTSILKVTGTCRWTGYDFAVINISTGYLVALLRSSILAQGILWPSCGHQY